MTILVPDSWLREYLETDASPHEIQEYLSLCGPSVERIEAVDGEPVYHIEVTTNRVDSMSICGIAREASAILPEFGIKAKLITPIGKVRKEKRQDPLGVTIRNDPSLCQRILAVRLASPSITPSPSLIATRLRLVGQRPLNNVVDITNYVMWEVGHPIHVFDYDRIVSKTIVVREAKPGESFVTLDGKTHTTSGGEVVFDDGTGTIIDLPGIMGTENTVVTERTKNILLWIESIDPVRIRQASLSLGIRSQAAILNEKGVDPELGRSAIERAIELYREVTNASVASTIVDIYPTKPKPRTVKLTQSLLEAFMGIPLDQRRVTRILTALGCSVTYHPEDRHFVIIPPSARAQDLRIPEDAVEEVARIYGYHRLPSELMSGNLPLKSQGIPFHLEDTLKNRLSDWGLTEVYTHSLISERLAKLSGFPLDTHLAIANPLVADQQFLRRSIIPSHLEVIANNPQRTSMAIFELANVYRKRKGSQLPDEHLQLVITQTADYTRGKAILQMLFRSLRMITEYLPQSETRNLFAAGHVATLVTSEKILGTIGELRPSLLAAFNLPRTLSVIQLDAQRLLEHTQPYPTFIPLPQHPPMIQDMTFKLPPKVYVGELIDEVKSLSRLVEAVDLRTLYQKNVTLRITFRNPSHSLTDAQVAPVRAKIIKHLRKQFGVRMVGSH